jgi:hypothetical protein
MQRRKTKRDDWCTPESSWKLALRIARIDAFDVDPFCNEHSTVPAHLKYMGKGGENHRMDRGDFAWANGPFSNPVFWFKWCTIQMERGAHSFGIARLDTSTTAWREYGPSVAWSPPYRTRYRPPPGVDDKSGATFVSAYCLWTEDELLIRRFSEEIPMGGYLLYPR